MSAPKKSPDSTAGQEEAQPRPPAAEPTPGGRGSPWLGRIAPAVLVVLAVGLSFSLGRFTAGGGEERGPGQAETVSSWTCSMHPQIQNPEAGKCPICGMDLVTVGAGSADALAPNRVTLSDRARTLARIETRAVKPFPNQGRAVRLLGRLDYDETRLKTVTAWTSGRIDRLRVGTTGERIKKNQAVAALYSPEVYTAHQDLIQARRQVDRLTGAVPIARASSLATLRAARQRLRLLGVSEGTLKKMEKEEVPRQRVSLHTPFGGTVIERMVSEGQYVETGQGIYRLADLSALWVQLDAYEEDLPLLGVGQSVSLEFEAFPQEVFEGRVAFIDPVINATTRTARVRVEVANPGGLKPGMYAEATVHSVPEEGAVAALVIPASAPLFSGRRSLVYVEVPGAARPTYEAREVRIGPRLRGFYPVIAGLEYGERVVTNGAFRLDADLQIRGGESLMARPDDTAAAPFDKAMETATGERKKLVEVMEAYLDIQEALSGDDLEAARSKVGRLEAVVSGIALEPRAAQAVWAPMQAEFAIHGRYFSRSTDLDGARAAFESLTRQVSRMLVAFGNPLERPVRLAYCPMAFNNRGALWFQRGDKVQNAYFGSEMPQCGEVRDTIGGGAFMADTPASTSKKARPASSPASSPASAPESAPSSGAASAPAGEAP